MSFFTGALVSNTDLEFITRLSGTCSPSLTVAGGYVWLVIPGRDEIRRFPT